MSDLPASVLPSGQPRLRPARASSSRPPRVRTTTRAGSRPLASVRPGARPRRRGAAPSVAAREPCSRCGGDLRPWASRRARSSTTSPTRRPTMRCWPSCRGSTASSAAADSRPGPTSSRFTRAGVAVRRHAWRDRDLSSSPSESLEQLARLSRRPRRGRADARAARDASPRRSRCLTAHQRDVLLALAVDGVPIDVLADRLSTNRNALYKTLHDARTRLRRAAGRRGDDTMTTPTPPLVAALLGPAGPEIGCDECFERLDGYVELRDRGRRRRGVDARHAQRTSPAAPRATRSTQSLHAFVLTDSEEGDHA